ncbi:MAG: HlyD family efflux transporter periplasmic adaptor subunit [Thermoanaerobaculia bacterium]
MIRDSSSMDRPIDKPKVLSRRNALYGAVILLALLALAVAYPSIRRWAQAETSVEISRIRIGEVVRGDLVRDVSADGRIVAAFHPTLFSPARGMVSLTARAGEVVEIGQVLCRVRSPELESRLEQARSTLLSLESDLGRQRILAKQTSLQNEQAIGLLEVELEAARRAMDRAQRTRDEGLLNAVEYEQAQDDVAVGTLKLDVAQKEAAFEIESLEFEVRNRQSMVEGQQLVVEELERQVDELTIRSPASGLVARVEVEDHDAVILGQPLVAVVDLSAFEVEFYAPESYADEIYPATAARVHYNGVEYEGEVRGISPEVEGGRVKGIVAFTQQAPEGLRQNQRVPTRLILETRSDVVKVPRGPFVESGGGRQAYVIEDGMAVLRPIQVGSLSVSEVEIVSGLEIGDQIILSDTARFDGAEKVLLRR